MIDPTLDPAAASFVESAAGSEFPIQNLPIGIFRAAGGSPRAGVAIGDSVLDLAAVDEAGLLDGLPGAGSGLFSTDRLNEFLALGRPAWSAYRARWSRLLSAGEARLRDDQALRARALLPQSRVELALPIAVPDYTDFYSSKEHARNVGTMFRGADSALMPNWVHMPIAYHGRSGSIVASGTPVRRPRGQTMADGAAAPSFGPSRSLDFELEVAFVIGRGSALGSPITVQDAYDHIYGLVLLNDWSARDLQRWEYQPLGPFLGKNFATSISPWIVSLDALAPFRVPAPDQDPEPLPYLRETDRHSFDIELDVELTAGLEGTPERIARSNYRYLYWTPAQQLAHHTVNGCNVRPGDLMASGTISGPERGERGSLLELAWRGTEPLALAGGATRSFLQDGDALTIRGRCRGPAFTIGFGEVTGRVLPAQG